MKEIKMSEKMRQVAFSTASLIPKRPSKADMKSANLARLVDSKLLDTFVTVNKGVWDNGKWLDLCDEISSRDFTPVDYDQVGLILERKKAEYFDRRES
jgi:hypothetical protein